MPNAFVRDILNCYPFRLCRGLEVQDNEPQAPPVQIQPPAAQAAPVATNTVTYTPPAQRPAYRPGQNYSIAELNNFVTSNMPSLANRPSFLADLLEKLDRPGISKASKAMLCKHLANLMTENDVLTYKAAPRQANYFASYSVDLTLQELGRRFSAAGEKDLRETLSLWANQLCPGQTEFNLNGVVYSRAEILDMIKSPNLISRQIAASNSDLATLMEARLHGTGSTSSGQTVHDSVVKHNGSRVLGMMRAQFGNRLTITTKEVVRLVTEASINKPAHQHIVAGMHYCLGNTNRDTSWGEDITPQQAIKVVAQYVLSVKDSSLKTSLTEAFLERLREIRVEGPCLCGVLQRLVDVPNGVDPRMAIEASDSQIAEEMARLAGKTRTHVDAIIEEGVMIVGEEEASEKEISNISKDTFRSRVDQDMGLFGGLPKNQLAPHIKRLEAGFD